MAQAHVLKQIAQAMLEDEWTQTQHEGVKIYSRSFSRNGDTALLMIKTGCERKLLAAGSGELFDELEGEAGEGYKLCPLTHHNRLVLNKYFDYTVPRAFGTYPDGSGPRREADFGTAEHSRAGFDRP